MFVCAAVVEDVSFATIWTQGKAEDIDATGIGIEQFGIARRHVCEDVRCVSCGYDELFEGIFGDIGGGTVQNGKRRSIDFDGEGTFEQQACSGVDLPVLYWEHLSIEQPVDTGVE